MKMVAKKEDGTVVKMLFKPIEDSVKEGMDSRNNIFVLSKNKVTFVFFALLMSHHIPHTVILDFNLIVMAGGASSLACHGDCRHH